MVNKWKIALVAVSYILVFWAGCSYRERDTGMDAQEKLVYDSLVISAARWHGQAEAYRTERDSAKAELDRFRSSLPTPKQYLNKYGHAIRSGTLGAAIDTLLFKPGALVAPTPAR